MFCVVAFYVYILASRKNGTLYVGSTDNLTVRISQHKQALIPGFTSKYGVKTLVWYELHDTREGAFRRERRIKEWKRAWKIRLIEADNLEWRDLYEEFAFGLTTLVLPPILPIPQTPDTADTRDTPHTPLIPAKAGTQDRSAEAHPDEAPASMHAPVSAPLAPICPGPRPSPG
jgi:putative endonuclease